MHVESRAIRRFDSGIVLDVVADDLPLRAYVAISAPDPEVVADFVPAEQFEGGSNLHVAAVAAADDASATVEDVLFNMDPDDAVAFLCGDTPSWVAVLELLGYVSDSDSLE